MATIRSAKITLSYPLYATEWNPHNANYLTVGGGGGPSRTGVANKITLLETAGASRIVNASEIELSASEDNVTSLAVGPHRDRILTVFAGVNGSPDDVRVGNNKHFRVLGISPPARSSKGNKSGGGGNRNSLHARISELSRESLFEHRDVDTYQRLLRLSQPYDGLAQLGAIASGLSKSPQIVLFDVPTSDAARWKPRAAGRLDPAHEPMDLDVVQTSSNTYQLAYCDDGNIFTVDVSNEEISDPKHVFTLADENGMRPKFRSLRYLTPSFICTVANSSNPAKKGVFIQGYRLPGKDEDRARVAVVRKLPKDASKATGLAVRNLTPRASPSDKPDQSQFVIAVAWGDSISLYTLEHNTAATVEVLANLAPFHTIKSAHPLQITSLTFSCLALPKISNKYPSELDIKLASVSVANTAVVHTIPLKKYVDKSSPTRRYGPPRPARYVVALRSESEAPKGVLVATALVILLMALVTQVFMEAKSMGPSRLGVREYLPVSWTVPLRTGPVVGGKIAGDLLKDVKPEQRAGSGDGESGTVRSSQS